jgi:hypothetical protein
MKAPRFTLAGVALAVITAGCSQHTPPPTAPSLTPTAPEMPPRTTPDSQPTVPPGSPTQPEGPTPPRN